MRPLLTNPAGGVFRAMGPTRPVRPARTPVRTCLFPCSFLVRRSFERRTGSRLPLADHLNAEREGWCRKPCRIWADGGSATIRSKSARENRLERMTGNPATCGYSDGIPFAHFLRTKKPLTFPASGRPRGGGVHFSIEWALGGMEPFAFPTDGPLMDRRSPEASRAVSMHHIALMKCGEFSS